MEASRRQRRGWDELMAREGHKALKKASRKRTRASGVWPTPNSARTPPPPQHCITLPASPSLCDQVGNARCPVVSKAWTHPPSSSCVPAALSAQKCQCQLQHQPHCRLSAQASIARAARLEHTNLRNVEEEAAGDDEWVDSEEEAAGAPGTKGPPSRAKGRRKSAAPTRRILSLQRTLLNMVRAQPAFGLCETPDDHSHMSERVRSLMTPYINTLIFS